MKIIKNTEISKQNLSNEQTEWVYCALDCALTHEIWDKVHKEFDGLTKRTYLFELDSLQPAMDMMLRGLRVDEEEVKTRKKTLRERRLKLERILNLFSQAVWEKDLNHNSPVQLKKILYEHLGLPPVVSYKGGKQKISTDRAALEQLGGIFIQELNLFVILYLRCVI